MTYKELQRRRPRSDPIVDKILTEIEDGSLNMRLPTKDLHMTQTYNSPTLLSFPPEIRNMIYFHILVSQRSIYIASSKSRTRIPGLLSTCRQIRTEALAIWYTQNTFKITIRRCDISHHLKFCKATVTKDFGNRINLLCHAQPGKRDWAKLLKWCEAVFHGEARPLAKPKSGDGCSDYVCVVATAQDIAAAAGREKGEWEECEKVLMKMREVLGRVDCMWLED